MSRVTDELKRIFESLDKNRDGQVSVDELEWLLQKTGVYTTRDELVLLVGKKEGFDINEFSYFYDSLVSKNHGAEGCCTNEIIEIIEDEDEEESYLHEAFKVFDLNGDGYLSPEEIKVVLLKLGMWSDDGGMDLARIVSTYDMNSDGLVDFEEFKIMMLDVQ